MSINDRSYYKGRKVIMTGGDGFIGSHLVEALVQQGAYVTILSRRRGYDLRHWNEAIIEVIQGADILYHLAGKSFVPLSWKQPREFYEANVGMTLNVLEACRVSGVSRMVHLSSYIYGTPQFLPITEDHPIDSTSPYARSKALAECLCRAYHEDFGISVVILRPFNIYGPAQDGAFLIPLIVNQIASGEVVLKDPVPKRDYLFISDFVRAAINAAIWTGQFGTFNIGSGTCYSVDEIVRKAIAIAGGRCSVRYTGEIRPNEIPCTIADISRAVEELDWKPSVSLEEGLRKVIVHESK